MHIFSMHGIPRRHAFAQMCSVLQNSEHIGCTALNLIYPFTNYCYFCFTHFLFTCSVFILPFTVMGNQMSADLVMAPPQSAVWRQVLLFFTTIKTFPSLWEYKSLYLNDRWNR